MIKTTNTAFYAGNDTLNEAAGRGDVETVTLLAPDASELERMVASTHALNNRQTDTLDVLLDAGIGEAGRNSLLERMVHLTDEVYVGRMLAEGTNERARGFALNRAAEWKRDGGEHGTTDDERLACVRLILDAGVAHDDRERARDKAASFDDATLVTLLA